MTTPTHAVAVLVNAGLTALTNSLTSGEPLAISKFELGELAAAEVPSNTTSAIPAAKYTGDSSKVLLEQENGLAVFNIVLDETIGDFFVGNVALKVIDPVTGLEVVLAVVMFPETVYKMASAAYGGGSAENGNYYLVKIVIKLSTLTSIATISVVNTTFSVLPSVSDIRSLADPSLTSYPHQLMLKAPETGAPALLARRQGDNLWWGFSLSWPVDAYNFGVISGGYQGDWYGAESLNVIFGGFFHMSDDQFPGVISGGVNWVGGSNTNVLNGGSWS